MHTVLDTFFIHCIVTCIARHHFCNIKNNSLCYHLPYVMSLVVGVYGDRAVPSSFIPFN